MGGRPSKGTPADKRLKANKPTPPPPTTKPVTPPPPTPVKKTGK